MSWIPVVAWLGALVVALVVLGFCAYELSWKSRRLRADLAGLQGLSESAQALQHHVTALQERAAAAQQLVANRRH